jgi:hypothetical protein
MKAEPLEGRGFAVPRRAHVPAHRVSAVSIAPVEASKADQGLAGAAARSSSKAEPISVASSSFARSKVIGFGGRLKPPRRWR